MSDTDVVSPSTPASEVTLSDLAERMDVLGQQMNWVCENLQSLFNFVNEMGQNGGGIRGLMKMLKQQQAIGSHNE